MVNVLKITQTCSLIGISRTTLWRWTKAGIFPAAIQLGPNRVGYFEADIDAWINSKR